MHMVKEKVKGRQKKNVNTYRISTQLRNLSGIDTVLSGIEQEDQGYRKPKMYVGLWIHCEKYETHMKLT